MAFLATLEGLGVPTRKKGGIFGACLGACDIVGSTVRGCLGAYADLTAAKRAIEALKANNAYDQNRYWMYKSESPYLTSLGDMDFPIYKFNEKFKVLKRNSPTTSDDAIAATVYFSMLAAQPVPTTEYDVVYTCDYDTETEQHAVVRYEDWPILEEAFTVGNSYYTIMLWPMFLKKDNAQNAYYDKVNQLQKYLKKVGLWSGIQKTLSEESRRLQGQMAAASASAAAAAKALAMARMSADLSQEGRIEAAKEIERTETEYNRALENEEKLKKALNNIQQGLPPETPDLPDEKTGEQSSGILPILGLAVAAAALMM